MNKISNSKTINFAIAAFLILLHSSFVQAQYDADNKLGEVLTQADAIRSQDIKTFSKLLEQVSAQSGRLSKLQKEHYDYLKAYEHIINGRIDESVDLAQRYLISFTDKELKFRTRMLLISALSMQRKWYDSMSQLNRLINELPIIDNTKVYNMGVQLVALTYNDYGRYEFTLDFLQRYDTREHSKRNACVALMNTVNARLHTNSMFLTPNRKVSTALCDDIGEVMASGFINVYAAQKLLKDGRASDALALMLEELESIEETQYSLLLVRAYATLSSIYRAKKNLEMTKLFAIKATELVVGIENMEPIATSYYNLYATEKELGNITSALEYLERYVKSQEAYLDEVKSKALAIQLAENDAYQQQSRIDLLNKQNALLSAQHQLSKSEAEYSRLIGGIAILIAILVGFWGIRAWRIQYRLKTSSEFDRLTNIYNRRHFFTLADFVLKLGNRSRQVVSCMTFKIDEMSQIKDSHGQTIGDWVLKKVAKSIQDCTRENDIFARLGKDEFILLLPSCDLASVVSVAEKCIQSIEHIDVAEIGHDFRVTASFGLSTSTESGYDMEIMMAHASEAMHHSKQNGKNHYVAYSDIIKLQRAQQES